MGRENQINFNESASGFWTEIILPLALPIVYTYEIPSHLIGIAKIGCRAEVVFGKNKKYAGIIKSITNQKPPYTTKSIINILDDAPIVYNQQLQLWKWMTSRTMTLRNCSRLQRSLCATCSSGAAVATRLAWTAEKPW